MPARSLIRPLPLTLGLVGLLSLACAKIGDPVPPVYTPSYTYDPPPYDGGQGISIGLVNPQLTGAAITNIAMQYAKMGVMPPVDGGEGPQSRAFRDATGRSLLQYFTSSGFTVSGPFRNVDEMTFPEKKQADLLLTVEFGILTDQPRPIVSRNNAGQVFMVTSEGDCAVRGTISFVLWEPLSMQRMWSKSVEVPAAGFSCTFTASNAADYDVMVGNGFNRAYEEAFQSTMRTAERYFSPEEVALVKSQARELREKKVY